MSKALEIAEERLAKGEISHEEFTKIKQNLQGTISGNANTQSDHEKNVELVIAGAVVTLGIVIGYWMSGILGAIIGPVVGLTILYVMAQAQDK